MEVLSEKVKAFETELRMQERQATQQLDSLQRILQEKDEAISQLTKDLEEAKRRNRDMQTLGQEDRIREQVKSQVFEKDLQLMELKLTNQHQLQVTKLEQIIQTLKQEIKLMEIQQDQ